MVDGVWGERSLPDGAEAGSMPVTHQCERDATGERSVSLAKMVLYYNTHLAVGVKPAGPNVLHPAQMLFGRARARRQSEPLSVQIRPAPERHKLGKRKPFYYLT